MELTSKQRAQLRGLANDIDTIVQVGKDGIGDNLIKQVNDALEARELIKGRVLENSMLTAREAAEQLAESRIPLLGCILNGATATLGSYGQSYYSSYYHYSRYGGYGGREETPAQSKSRVKSSSRQGS